MGRTGKTQQFLKLLKNQHFSRSLQNNYMHLYTNVYNAEKEKALYKNILKRDKE